MKKLLILTLIILVGASVAGFWYFYPQYAQYKINKVVSEISAVPQMEEHFLNEIKKQECKDLEKNSFWTVRSCNGEVFYKIFFKDNGYYVGYCVVSESVKEAFQKIGPHLTPPRACINETDEPTLIASDDVNVYRLCGLSLVFKDECIVGVGE